MEGTKYCLLVTANTVILQNIFRLNYHLMITKLNKEIVFMLKTSVGVHPPLVVAAKTTQSKVSIVTHCLACLNYSTMQPPVMHQKLGKVHVVYIP